MSLEKTWSLKSVRGRSQLQQQPHWRASYFNSPRAQFMDKMERRKKYTVLNWNIWSRSWKSLRPRHLSSTTSSTLSNGYAFNFRKLWCWTTTTLRRGIVARFVCSWPTLNREALGSIYSATLEKQHKRCGLIYHGVQRITSKPTHGFTAKGKKSQLSYTTS